MKCRWNYVLPLALAVAVAPAMAMELGPIRVESTLDSPLLAEIPVIEDYPGEANGLKATLASDADFARAGIRRADLHTPLKFSVVGRTGHRVIRVTSTQPVRAPFLDVLVKATWPKGKLLREYTMLLDPAVSQWHASGTTAGSASGATQPGSAAALPPATHASAAPQPQHAESAASGISVNKGDTLFRIASNHPIDGVDQNQMLLALKAANPDAFFQNNINALMAGSVLRVPTRQEALKIDKRAADAAVMQQNHAWQNQQQPAIAVSAGSGQGEPAEHAAAASSGDHLSLVPPARNKGVAAAGAATSNADASVKELRQALARSKESLSSQTQTASDLQSRVDALEGLQKKTQELLSLKNAEIATLRVKLAAARKQAGLPASAATAPAALAGTGTVAATAPTAAAGSVAADTDSDTGQGTPPASETATTSSQDTGAGAQEAVASAAAPAPGSAVPPTQADDGAVAQQASEKSSEAAAQPTQTGAATTVQDEQSQASAQPTATTQASAKEPAKEEAATNPTTSKPAAATATGVKHGTASHASTGKIAPTTAAMTHRAEVATPWYERFWARLVLGLIVVLLLVAWAITRRRPRDVLVAPEAPDEPVAPSLTDVDDFPPAAAAEPVDATATSDDGEAELLHQLAANPEDVGLHLELASLYYARGDVDRFEAVSESMHAYLEDDTQPEWQEVLNMGRELAPDHPLFIDVPATTDATADAPSAGDWSSDDLDMDDVSKSPEDTAPAAAVPVSAAAGEDVADDDDTPTWHVLTEPTPAQDGNVDNDDLPPLEMDMGTGTTAGTGDGRNQHFPSGEPKPTMSAFAGDTPTFEFDADSIDELSDDTQADDTQRIDAESFAAQPFDLDPDDAETVGIEPDDLTTLGMELDAGSEDANPVAEASSLAVADGAGIHAESALSLEDDSQTGSHAEDLTTAEDALPALNVPSDDFSGDAVDTKLDLARAYIDLNDTEGAKAMLHEALDEGSQMQRDAAQKLLDGLA